MLRFSFIYPGALWLLLVLVPLWVLTLTVPRRLPPWRFWGSLGLRTLLILCLIFSLAGMQLVYGVRNITTVFLVDSSDSISPSAYAQAEQFIREALRTMGSQDRAAVVVFGENALVERAPDSSREFGRIASVPVASRTNIEEAIQLGLALFPADSQKRLVLLSDGGENVGNAMTAAQLAASGNVPIDIIDLSLPDSGGEALIASLEAPTHVREGQEIRLTATIESTVAQSARLRIFADQEVIVDQQQQLEVGLNRFSVAVPASTTGFQRYRAQIEPEIDGRVQNNEAAVLVQVQGPPRVLLVEGQRGDARNLHNALTAASVNAETVAPGDMPVDLAQLSNYEAVILVNVPARNLPAKAMTTLPGYVRDLGKGLMMIGGEESFGVGGYGRTPIEEVLPVYMDVRNREERPNLALVFIIDKSGSMDACHCAGPDRSAPPLQLSNVRKVDIAKEAIIQATPLLGEQDKIGIVSFEEVAYVELEATRAPTVDQVLDAVSGIEPRGGTSVRSGLLEAERMLQNTDARIKHAILLTDGWGSGGDNFDLAERMRAQGMTLSVVAAGSGSADFLEQLAIKGGGRYYASEDMGDVPQIFVQETINAVGNYIIEEPFYPQIAANSPILDGFEAGLPQLFGYNGTTLKDTARNVLVTDDRSPILAQWQYGLGRSIAWTSDVRGKWARNWVRWEQFPRFAAQMVGWIVPDRSANSVLADIQVDGMQTIVNVTVADSAGVPREDLHMTATLVGSNNQTNQSVPLTQVAPGIYRASVPSPAPGTYLVQLSGEQEGRTIIQDVAGLVVPYSPEYRLNQSNPALLAELMRVTGGNRIVTAADAFTPTGANVNRAQEIALPMLLLVLLLLPIDIAVRRLVVRRSDLEQARAWMQTRMQRQPAPALSADTTLTRLAQAKRRATPSTGTNNRQQSPAPPPTGRSPTLESMARPSAAAPPSDPLPSPPPTTDPLERLRVAKERARRRARGEE